MIDTMNLTFLPNTWCKFVLNKYDARGENAAFVAAHVSECFHTGMHVVRQIA